MANTFKDRPVTLPQNEYPWRSGMPEYYPAHLPPEFMERHAIEHVHGVRVAELRTMCGCSKFIVIERPEDCRPGHTITVAFPLKYDPSKDSADRVTMRKRVFRLSSHDSRTGCVVYMETE